MNKAKDLLLTLLPSNSTIVRRGASEGLALLATLGVTEDAHFLQSSLLHSLDEVMQGNKPDGKARTIALEPVSAARAGSLLTLACIQRTAYNVQQRKNARAGLRAFGSKTEDAVDKANESLPLLQMMTRILPSAACHGFRDYFAVKTYALHSFAVLLIYCARLKTASPAEEDLQLLRKAIELLEDNLAGSWTAASVDVDRGQEAEKMASEIVFLAAILRLMSSLLPFLHHLKTEDKDVARRFAFMASVILDSHAAHPAVFIEGMAFFEVLSSHLPLLLPPTKRALYSEDPVFTFVPRLLSALTPCSGRNMTRFAMISSMKGRRAAVYLIKAFSDQKISLAHWTKMEMAALLFSNLEVIRGQTTFHGGGLLHFVATSREVERFFIGESTFEREMFATAPALMLLERAISVDKSDALLRWMLLCRQILAPFALNAIEADSLLYTRGIVSNTAVQRAISDGNTFHETSGSVRWQVKCLAAQVAAESMREMRLVEADLSDKLDQSPHFDAITARKVCGAECLSAYEAKGTLPSSYLVFHLEDVVSSACMSAVATVDQTELRSLQNCAMHFLHGIISCFGSIRDPENPSDSILGQYSTQIFSSIKHALSVQSEVSFHLFITGCEALQAAVEEGVTTDNVVLKRLLRPLVPPPECLPLFQIQGGQIPELFDKSWVDSDDIISQPACRIASLWTLGEVLLRTSNGETSDSIASVKAELIDDEIGVPVQCAAAAVDGCHLLRLSNVSLGGLLSHVEVEANEAGSLNGFLIENYDDVDDVVKALLGKVWSSCSTSAIRSMLRTATREEEFTSETCREWISTLFTLSVAGLYDSVEALTSEKLEIQAGPSSSIDPSQILYDCLHGIVLVVQAKPDFMQDRIRQEMEPVIELVCNTIMMPTLNSNGSHTHTRATIHESCKLVQLIAESGSDLFVTDSSLIVAILQPLNILEKDSIEFDDPRAGEIVCASLASVASIVSKGNDSVALIHATLQLVLRKIRFNDITVPKNVKIAAKSLLNVCLQHKSISRREKENLACEFASTCAWDAWEIVSLIHNGKYIARSLLMMSQTLQDPTKYNSHAELLATVRSVVQKAPVPSDLVGRIVFSLGGDIIGSLYQYGTLKISEEARPHRLVVCADAMKIVLLAYQQIASEDVDDSKVTEFIHVVFSALLAIVRFNGLPNTPSPEPRGDAALGRMAAQAIVHVARSTPALFKSSVAGLVDHERILLEFTVRAEMSGYPAPAHNEAPVKKKLDLKSFKK
jgi:hypothetical protein